MKSLNIIQLYEDNEIPFSTKGKNCSPGWINTRCCFCDDHSDHLGYHLQKEYVSCRRCGWHPLDATIAALLGQTLYEAREVIQQYRTGRPIPKGQIDIVIKERPSKIRLPGELLNLNNPKHQPHFNYLEKRGFKGDNLHWLINTYKLHGTGPLGNYKFRIVAPIYFDGNLVSYQGRDYTGKSPLKYKACPKTEEVRDHKHCLFAMDLAQEDTIVVAEGVYDAMKLGHNAVATFGTSFTLPQVRLLVERWNKRIILFDKDAQTQAEKLATILSAFPGETLIAILDDLKDPGELTVERGREIMKGLGL